MMKFEIPFEVADDITLTSLKNHYQIASERFTKWHTGAQWMHRDDVYEDVVTMHHLKAVIEYYGGSID